MKLLKRQTPDIKFKYNTFEIGVGEIKPFNISEELINEDRIRIGEMMKRMLHKRVLGAKEEKELSTFGILFAGHKIEYFVHEYKPHGPNQYTFRLIKESTLPTLPSIFHNMTLSLDCLFHFKSLMKQSHAVAADVEKPYKYSGEFYKFKPTITLLNVDED